MKTNLILALLILAACNSKPGAVSEKDSTIAAPAAPTPVAVPVPSTDPVAPNEAYLIVPGKAIGNTHINDNMDSVIKLLGKPDDGDAAMQKSVVIYYKGAYATSILSARNPDGDNPIAKVKQIRVTSPAFKTEDGLHVGSSIDELNAMYQLRKTTTYTGAGGECTVWDAGHGIAFETDPAKNCIAVIVYSPEGPYQGAALNIRPNRKP
ncbi:MULTISPECIES: hypothetical protein [unclassified Chitinophaga]|uniref:hypothetical protein n=1 Tax=unclassified Chitinophaga TaxID=2619133 RepID=UPI0009D49E5A|nr:MULTISPECIES: hypothetical protein [unclassified Chitinophaga]OMP74571.1 hypothetical protein BW716_34690 [[Flexibacter] sp. ATCC 35208]WPV64680.1 hypothetical protein QQL36_23030 [Chitinophaga sp. LS1]